MPTIRHFSLLFLVPVLVSCGGSSNPEDAASNPEDALLSGQSTGTQLTFRHCIPNIDIVPYIDGIHFVRGIDQGEHALKRIDADIGYGDPLDGELDEQYTYENNADGLPIKIREYQEGGWDKQFNVEYDADGHIAKYDVTYTDYDGVDSFYVETTFEKNWQERRVEGLTYVYKIDTGSPIHYREEYLSQDYNENGCIVSSTELQYRYYNDELYLSGSISDQYHYNDAGLIERIEHDENDDRYDGVKSYVYNTLGLLHSADEEREAFSDYPFYFRYDTAGMLLSRYEYYGDPGDVYSRDALGRIISADEYHSSGEHTSARTLIWEGSE